MVEAFVSVNATGNGRSHSEGNAKDQNNKKLKPNFKKEIFIPTYEKKNGNPVLFTKHMKEKIMQISGNDGAKELIEIYQSKALHIPVKNRGITLDFDIQEDFNPSL